MALDRDRTAPDTAGPLADSGGLPGGAAGYHPNMRPRYTSRDLGRILGTMASDLAGLERYQIVRDVRAELLEMVGELDESAKQTAERQQRAAAIKHEAQR